MLDCACDNEEFVVCCVCCCCVCCGIACVCCCCTLNESENCLNQLTISQNTQGPPINLPLLLLLSLLLLLLGNDIVIILGRMMQEWRTVISCCSRTCVDIFVHSSDTGMWKRCMLSPPSPGSRVWTCRDIVGIVQSTRQRYG